MTDKSMFLAKYGDSDHAKEALKSHDQNTIEQAARNPSLGKEDIDKLVNSPSSYKRESVARNPNLSKEHIDKLVNDSEEDVRSMVAEHPKASREHLDKAMRDDSHWVTNRALLNKNTTLEQAKVGYKNLSDKKSMFAQHFKKEAKILHGYDL